MIEIGSGDALIKFAPPATVAGADAVGSLFGLTLNEWFYVAMIVYMIIMAVNDFLDKKSARTLREREDARKDKENNDG